MHRSFYVNLNGSKSSVFQLSYGVPQGSVLGPLLFILYTTPFSTIISKSATSHHLYTDDTQLYMYFAATKFCQNISHLENTISLVQNWMSSNFLSLNPPKTKFLIIGLRQQLAKLNHPTISLPNSVTLCPVSLLVIWVFTAYSLQCLQRLLLSRMLMACQINKTWYKLM
jgi:hypothetical protein